MWEIYAYQNADSLFGVFNAAAAIHASGDYLSAVAAVAFCGFVAALIAYAFAPEKLQGWKWLGTVVLVFSVLIVPKVTIGIVDKTGGSAVKVVDNVPFGVAVLGSLTSTIGNTLTGLFETAFQVIPGIGALPAELSYQQNGLMFGNRLIRETGNVVFQDPAFRTDLINFIHNCTTYDLIDGTLDPATFSASDDVWPLMASPNPARFSTLTAAGGSVGVDTCPNVYQSLNGRLPAQITRIQGRLAFQLNPTLPGAAAAAVIAGQIQQAYLKNSIATAAANAADLIRQNAVLNAIEDTSKIVGQKVNDPAAMVLAVGRAQAVAQQNATWLNYGKVAEQALPVFRNVVEAVTYAMFPLFVLLLLLTSGRETMLAFKGYAAVLIWIQLWPPLYAILNYMASIYAAYDLAAAADLGTGTKALALQTASTIYSRAISGEAIVGYLAISIPFIAWAALKRMENFGTALVGGLSGLQAMISGGTSASTVGNVSMGNVGMDQMQLAPNRTSAFMGSWQNDLSGNTFSSNALTGRTAVSLLRNQGFASRVVSMRVSEQDVTDASRQVDAARSEAVAANQERATVLSEAFSRGLTKLKSSRSSTGSTTSSFEQFGDTLTRLDQITKSVADTTGLSQAQVARIALGASGHLGINTPLAGLQGNANADKSYTSGLSSAEQRALASLSSEQLAEFKQFGDRVSRDRSFATVIANDARDAHDMASRLATTTTRSERSEASLAERTAFAERVSTAYERGETISIDIAQDPHNLEMFTRYAEQYGGNSAAARTLMEAELARQSLKPNRTFSDGTAMPLSFGDLRHQHAQDAADPALTLDIASRHRQHTSDVRRFDGTAQPMPNTTHPPSHLRDEVQAQGKRIRATTAAEREAFEREAQITQTPDRTLASKRSLMKQTGKQVKEDVAPLIDDAKQAVKDALRK
ncbi:MAG: conjugal transfer mating pair stabilization protein TraG [Candidatus Accumulibacter appositus]|uniref:Conjugal transfer mating pair stabilization protein TraG n=1 Tax=Candidatus Accumulibacter appositus TaxID=1454003 RepID=A0A011QNT4_9PROT|nr:conjugal transfer protein TraG N-terminal domain-containing protein [Accumulibacter sp.]EXI80479.1 MAG: conjugal transfer mating pair stabilization protein TraG [Candidatus Accumulibacter appositus]HRF06478.1 conjugal transfer protein TraG N-terminal domain-containing protein [Accumulibacter sp.]